MSAENISKNNMNQGLGLIFGKLRASLPKDARSKPTHFSTASFPSCPDRIETNQLIVTKASCTYGTGYRTDRIIFHATKPTYQELGLLILAAVFREGGHRTHIVLNHPHSTIKNLVISYSGLTPRASGQKTRPEYFPYCPSKVEKHPWKWRGHCGELSSFPSFTLTNIKEFVVSEADWASRDTVMGFGNDDANIRLADLLLNIGYSDLTEVILEGEGGHRGVGIHSAEAAFYLPGSPAWPQGISLGEALKT